MIEAIVLAAGKGERLRMIKPLIMINGETALARVIRTLKKAQIERIAVVLGHAAKTVLRDVNLTGCKVVINQNYKMGMASSLALGIESLSAKAQGFLILHADMPYIKEETIRAVLTIAIASLGALLHVEGDLIQEVRLAAGSVAPTPIRLQRVEERVNGERVTGSLIEEARKLAGQSVSPIDDIRASADYRRTVIADLVAYLFEGVLHV
jgi:CTP:molybdopterin cytidylyltransferase MocA